MIPTSAEVIGRLYRELNAEGVPSNLIDELIIIAARQMLTESIRVKNEEEK